MLYHLLAGVPPYNARTATDVIAAAALGKVVPLAEREQRAPRRSGRDRRARDGAEPGRSLRRTPASSPTSCAGSSPASWSSAHRYTAVQRVGAVRQAPPRGGDDLGASRSIGVRRRRHARGPPHRRTSATRAEHERSSRSRASRPPSSLIDYMFSDMKDAARRRSAGSTCSPASAPRSATTTRRSRASPAACRAEDEIRMAEAIDLIGHAERDVGQARPGARDLDARRASSSPRSSAATRRRATRRAAPDDRAARLRDRHDLPASAASSTRRSRVLEAAQTRVRRRCATSDPNRSSRPARRRPTTHDRLGDLLRNDGKIDAGVRGVHARPRASASAPTSRANGTVRPRRCSRCRRATSSSARSTRTAASPAPALDEYSTALRAARDAARDPARQRRAPGARARRPATSSPSSQRQLGDDDARDRDLPAARCRSIEALVRRDPTNTDVAAPARQPRSPTSASR